MKLTNKTNILFSILIFLTILGVHLIVWDTFMTPVIFGQMNPTAQLVEASNLYNEPYILPDILITSQSPDARYNIKDILSIDFSITDTSFLPEADMDGISVKNGDTIKVSELAIGKHTMTGSIIQR